MSASKTLSTNTAASACSIPQATCWLFPFCIYIKVLLSNKPRTLYNDSQGIKLNTKSTLRMKKNIIEQIKMYSMEQDKSVSSLIETLYKSTIILFVVFWAIAILFWQLKERFFIFSILAV